MKKTISIASLLVAMNLNCAAQKVSESDVPGAVKQALTASYPNAKVSKWEKEEGKYEAEFKNNGVETSVVFDPQGKIEETEVAIPTKELPAAAKDYISKQYGSAKISEAAKITSSDGTVSFEAEVAKNDLIFDSSGKYLKSEKEDDDDED